MGIIDQIQALRLAAERNFSRPTLSARDDMIIRYYVTEGGTLRQVAIAADCCVETVRNVLRRHGYKTRPRGRNSRYTHCSQDDLAN